MSNRLSSTSIPVYRRIIKVSASVCNMWTDNHIHLERKEKKNTTKAAKVRKEFRPLSDGLKIPKSLSIMVSSYTHVPSCMVAMVRHNVHTHRITHIPTKNCQVCDETSVASSSSTLLRSKTRERQFRNYDW